MSNSCKHPTCNGVCRRPPKKNISARSTKSKSDSPAYRKFIAAFLAKPGNDVCNIQIDENCTYFATTANHLRRRSKDHKMNEEDLEPSCYYCNIKIEEKDAWARANGHLKSKFTPVTIHDQVEGNHITIIDKP